MKSHALLFFSLCAVADFGLGYSKGHSIGAGFAWVVFGLPFTAVLFITFTAVRARKREVSAAALNVGMRREEVERVLRENVGKRVRVTFTDGVAMSVDVTKR